MVENEAGTPSKRPWSHGPWNSFMGAVAGIYDATGARIGFFNRAEDAEYVVSLSAHIEALEAQLAEARQALGMMLKEHDILSGNFGDVMDPKHKRPDRWPTAAEAARHALEGGE